jgi:hypothetical protein
VFDPDHTTMTPRFDPTRAVVFDLARGQLRDDEGASRLNLPTALVERLCAAAGSDAARDFGLGLGAEVGRRVADRLPADSAASLGAWTEHLGGHLALLGLGSLRTERWGRALVLRVSGVARELTDLLGNVLEGALTRGLSRTVSLVPFGAEEGVAYLVVNPNTAERARSLAASGQGLGSVVEALHRGSAA